MPDFLLSNAGSYLGDLDTRNYVGPTYEDVSPFKYKLGVVRVIFGWPSAELHYHHGLLDHALLLAVKFTETRYCHR